MAIMRVETASYGGYFTAQRLACAAVAVPTGCALCCTGRRMHASELNSRQTPGVRSSLGVELR
jgi:hypothetical protein